MIAALIERRITATEAALGEPMDWVRDLWRTSRSAFFKFWLFEPLARHRAAAPIDAYYVAKLVAVQHEDCGPCLQTVVNLAKMAGVDRGVIAETIAGRLANLTPLLARVAVFATAVVERSPDAGELGAALEQELGRAALVDLAFAIATTRVFPTVKRALGYAESCAAVRLEL